jgi:uncharacterized protein
MTDSSAQLHEPADQLRPQTIEAHRGIVSLIEEFEAVDWYAQRVDATSDPELRAVLAHNRDEEKEHAVMTLEWLRRRDPVLDAHLRTYLFTESSIVRIEEEDTAEESGNGASNGELRIGALSPSPPSRPGTES